MPPNSGAAILAHPARSVPGCCDAGRRSYCRPRWRKAAIRSRPAQQSSAPVPTSSEGFPAEIGNFGVGKEEVRRAVGGTDGCYFARERESKPRGGKHRPDKGGGNLILLSYLPANQKNDKTDQCRNDGVYVHRGRLPTSSAMLSRKRGWLSTPVIPRNWRSAR